MNFVGGNISIARAFARNRGAQALTLLGIVILMDIVTGLMGHQLVTGRLEVWLRAVFYTGFGLFLVDSLVFVWTMQFVGRGTHTRGEAWAYFNMGFTWRFLRRVAENPLAVRVQTRMLLRNEQILRGHPWLKARIEDEQSKGHLVCLAVLNETYLPSPRVRQRRRAGQEKRAAQFEERRQRREEKVAQRARRKEEKRAEEERRAEQEAAERREALLQRAKNAHFSLEVVRRLINEGNEGHARNLIERAEAVQQRLGAQQLKRTIRAHLEMGELEVAEAIVALAETEERKARVMENLRDQVSQLNDGRRTELLGRIEALTKHELDSRGWRKEVYAIEKELGRVLR